MSPGDASAGLEQARDHDAFQHPDALLLDGFAHRRDDVGMDAAAQPLGLQGPLGGVPRALGQEPGAVRVGDEADPQLLQVVGQGPAVARALKHQVQVADAARGGVPILEELLFTVGLVQHRRAETDQGMGTGAALGHATLVHQEHVGAASGRLERCAGRSRTAADHQNISR